MKKLSLQVKITYFEISMILNALIRSYSSTTAFNELTSNHLTYSLVYSLGLKLINITEGKIYLF
ncbi:hypothetical protein LCDVSa146R [Lymphocystis disease virus 3]|uniref:Uncharacterized protein n=1 Tax=Lymphocystis disease virus 3 TaxID=2560566 RepID=A0A1B2RW46_9VIRU|nr:hypothetical protein BZK12_gp146 [Lymphocystis disease virus Sa]AOC55230.1 hypothetical protein LCDVSa146R [Lymphocystis disease virus 3]